MDHRRPVLVGRTFTDEHLDLTGQQFEGCTFDGCILELRRSTRISKLRRCDFNDCELRGNGWPSGVAQRCFFKGISYGL